MVELVAPTLPLRLYRYRPLHSKDEHKISQEKLERELKAICDNYLWCSPLKELNDPMEGTFGLTPTVARAEDIEVFLKEVCYVMEQMGVCCFSDTRKNDLMWVHYAGDYRGICVEYSTNDLNNGLLGVRAARVQYDIEIPPITAEEFPDRQTAAVKILTSKKFNWHYEREWRLLTNRSGKLEIKGQNPVKGIYFGPRAEPDAIDAFRRGLSGVRNNTIRFHRPKALNRYEYEWEEIK